MSKRDSTCQKIAKAIGDLILILEDYGVIDFEEILRYVGFSTSNIVVRKPTRKTKKINYEEIAPLILDGAVFLEIDRRAVWYAKKRLEEILNKKVKAIPSDYEGVKGYTFMISPEGEQR